MGLKAANIHSLLYEVPVQPLRMLVQSEPHSLTEYVHFEPSPVMVCLGSIKDFHVVRAIVGFLGPYIIVFVNTFLIVILLSFLDIFNI